MNPEQLLEVVQQARTRVEKPSRQVTINHNPKPPKAKAKLNEAKLKLMDLD